MKRAGKIPPLQPYNMKIGDIGGGSPFVKIAALPAELSAESAQKAPKTTSEFAAFAAFAAHFANHELTVSMA